MQRGRGESPRPKRVHLVLHEGDEWRDHNGGAVEQERGKLKAERLAGAGGHHRHQVPALEYGERRLALTRTKGRETESLVQCPIEIGGGGRMCGR